MENFRIIFEVFTSVWKTHPRRPRGSWSGGRDFRGRKFYHKSGTKLSPPKIPFTRPAAPGWFGTFHKPGRQVLAWWRNGKADSLTIPVKLNERGGIWSLLQKKKFSEKNRPIWFPSRAIGFLFIQIENARHLSFHGTAKERKINGCAFRNEKTYQSEKNIYIK